MDLPCNPKYFGQPLAHCNIVFLGKKPEENCLGEEKNCVRLCAHQAYFLANEDFCLNPCINAPLCHWDWWQVTQT
jgi:hypothetical protein